MRLTALDLLCQHAADQDHRQVVEQLERELPDVHFTHNATVMLYELFSTASASTCKGVNLETVVSLAMILRDNPRYTNQPLYNQAYQNMLAAIARQQGDYDAVIDHLQQAITHWPSPDLNAMVVMAMGGAGKFDAARDFIDDAEASGPVNPAKAVMWRRDLERLRGYIRKLEQDARTQPTGQAVFGRETEQS
jgi:tetratricopeptide (TPR) repeat protein